MPDRYFEEQKSTITLRRSPRFVHGDQTPVKNPATLDVFSTPESQTRKNHNGISVNRRIKSAEEKAFTIPNKRSSRLEKSECRHLIEKRVTRSSARGSRFVHCQDSDCTEISGKGDREVSDNDCKRGSRRSARFDKGANVRENVEILGPHNEYVMEKRVTRSLVRGNKFLDESCSEGYSAEEGLRGLSKEGKGKVGVEFCELSTTEKRVTHSSSQTKINVKIAVSHERKLKCDSEYESKRDAKECENEGVKEKICIGKKRKRDDEAAEEKCELVQGWSKEQEMALERAYFTAKPTPHFWKKVARMVPGKSTEECFDKIHSELLTPQPRTRSREKRKVPSPLSFSATDLLSPAATKTKKPKSSRRKSTIVSRKTVRQLLQKQQNEDQDYPVDLFAVFEPSMNQSRLNVQEGTSFASPPPKHGSGCITRSTDMSSSAHKMLSSEKAGFVSPPVLKQIKNKALHEKYVDQLHRRDAKRKAQSLRKDKCIQDQNDNKVHVNSVKFAKDALIFSALDGINQFRNQISSTNNNSDDDDDDDVDEDEDVDDEVC